MLQVYCRNFIGRSLILMGEIGGNDYNFPLSTGRPVDEVQSYVPLVIDTIISAINVRSYSNNPTNVLNDVIYILE
ncbi:putative sinapine esterase [Helianthus debilis subsp. tardiflorus]